MLFEFEELIRRVEGAIKNGTEKELAQLCREFNSPVMNIVRSQWVTSNCSDILFINLTPQSVLSGGTINVNNYTLQPGGFFGVMGNNAEKNVDTYNVVFDTAATLCVIIKKLYVNK